MEQLSSELLRIDWTSPTFLPICIAIVAGLLAKVRVITARNHKAVCISIAVIVGIGYAVHRSVESTLSLDRLIPLLVVYTLAISCMSWLWLYLAVYGQFRSAEPEPKDRSRSGSTQT